MPRLGGKPNRRRQAPLLSGQRRRLSQSIDVEITMLATALRELAAIRETAEEAADCILASAEQLLAVPEPGARKRTEEAVMSIVSACGFHDLVGQRAAKITAALDQIIALREAGMDRPRKESGYQHQRRQVAPLLNGPAMPGTGVDQARIDALFAKA